MRSVIYLSDMFVALATDMDLDPWSVSYAVNRLKNEGVRFLTVTLPALAKSVLSSLELGYFDRPTSFAWKGRSLRFMRSSLLKIFNPDDGTVNTDHNVVAQGLAEVRQVCEYFYKMAFSFTDEENEHAIEKYKDKEKELATTKFCPFWLEQLRKDFETNHSYLSALLPHQVFSSSRPRYTSGSFFESEKGIHPYYIAKQVAGDIVPEKLKPFSGYFKPYPSSPPDFKYHAERRCQVLFVPKDSRGPRVISKEPLSNLRAQMSYFDTVTELLEVHTKGRVQFTDQTIFRELACKGSLDRSMACLDLKDASDSVHRRLVKHLFRHSPAMRYFTENTRSTHAVLPTGGTLQLEKLAGMGSGLTFPTMALVIFLSICSHVSRQVGVSYKDICPHVYVYGDDVIVPSKYYHLALAALQSSGLTVNRQKSFHKSLFRESCGGDYYYGQDVTPVRLKLASSSLKEPAAYRKTGRIIVGDNGILEIERHARELFSKGLYTLREYFYKRIERALGPLPVVSINSPVLGRVDFPDYITNFCEKAWVAPGVKTTSAVISPVKHLGKCLTQRSDYCTHDKLSRVIPDQTRERDPFGVLAIPRKVQLKRRLVTGLIKLSPVS